MNKKGFTLIQLVATMAILSIGVLIAMTVIKGQSTILKKAKSSQSGVVEIIDLVAVLKKDLGQAFVISGIPEGLSIQKRTLIAGEIKLETVKYINISDCGEAPCLERESGTKKYRFSGVNSFEWCFKSKGSDCSLFTRFMPSSSSHSSSNRELDNTFFIEVTPKGKKKNKINAVFDLRNISNPNDIRNNYIILNS